MPPAIVPSAISLKGVGEVLSALEAGAVYLLYYRTNIVGNSFKVFSFAGTKQEAFKRGQEHCKKMGYRFVSVIPFFTDLDVEEKAHTSQIGDALKAAPPAPAPSAAPTV